VTQSRCIYRVITSVITTVIHFFVHMLGKLLDVCIPYWIAARFNCLQNLPSTRCWSFFFGRLKKVSTWKRKFPQCLRRPVTALYVSTDYSVFVMTFDGFNLLSCHLTWSWLNVIRRKKNTCGSGFRPTLFFSADPIIFSTRLTVRPYFLQVVAGCSYSVPKCDNNHWMASVVTIIIEPNCLNSSIGNTHL
jgi:hypothetical protein